MHINKATDASVGLSLGPTGKSIHHVSHGLMLTLCFQVHFASTALYTVEQERVEPMWTGKRTPHVCIQADRK